MMRKRYVAGVLLALAAIVLHSFSAPEQESYPDVYGRSFTTFREAQERLVSVLAYADLQRTADKERVRQAIQEARLAMKATDFWMRYLEPLAYKKINAPLPVEWETEVFEKFERPYKREGAGLMLAMLYLDEPTAVKDSLLQIIRPSLAATDVYRQDSIAKELGSYDHFYLCNRLFLLNLAAIYTTGFECPDPTMVIPELKTMLNATGKIYASFNRAFPATPLPADYLQRFDALTAFVAAQPNDHTRFDHFTFIRDHVNPLFMMNQELVMRYNVVSHSLVDYTLNKHATSIFDKTLYNGQNPKGLFIRVQDSSVLALLERTGRLLFYDPILSGNNERSCASCHKPSQYFTDTATASALQFDRTSSLPRNSPSLINAMYYHLIMADGRHISLQGQAQAVITDPKEMNCDKDIVVDKVMSCRDHKKAFDQLLQYTPQEKEVNMGHITSALTWYYSKFSRCYSPFDDAMNSRGTIEEDAKAGFNLFMGKAQCGTCHFVPQFNGTKPPYVSSEFEVLGVPADARYTRISPDTGRCAIHQAPEMRNAFRTSTVRNAAHTGPYMHNGVFGTIEEVMDFYDAGGGAGHGLDVPNQTLAADSIKLTPLEKRQLVAFIRSLDERIIFDGAPEQLPVSRHKEWNSRKVGGTY